MKNNIYCFCILTGSNSYGLIRDADPNGDTMGYAVNDKGEILVKHFSSGVEWSKHDLGITSDWNHNIYDDIYGKDNYDLIWLGLLEDFENLKNVIVTYEK